MLLTQIDYLPILKVYGPLGLFCALAIVLVTRLFRYIQKQHEEHIRTTQALAVETQKAAQALTEDARKERDYSRELREQEASACNRRSSRLYFNTKRGDAAPERTASAVTRWANLRGQPNERRETLTIPRMGAQENLNDVMACMKGTLTDSELRIDTAWR